MNDTTTDTTVHAHDPHRGRKVAAGVMLAASGLSPETMPFRTDAKYGFSLSAFRAGAHRCASAVSRVLIGRESGHAPRRTRRRAASANSPR